MRAPLSWLRSLTPLPSVATDRGSVADVGSELDALGLVVEGIEWVGEGIDDVVLAQVLDISAIPGADRIRRVVLDAGGGGTVEVVCGAWNFEVGDVVPLAPVGSTLPGEFRIERRKMKGVVSNGMICSARELRLGDDHEGIMVLARPHALSTAGDPRESGAPAGVDLGRPIGDFLGTPDVVFDLAVEANRPDCLCMLGIARDLAARYGLPLLGPEPLVAESGPAAAELASVEVVDASLCRRLTGRVMTGLNIVASPPLVQRRLSLAGMRPIDCVVDATNYVMLELGQPTHPYDLDELGGHGLRVRAAHPGETVVTLDGAARILGARSQRRGDPVTELDCVICNANDLPVGIGGIMGGRSSEISATTSRVLLEAADFPASAVGRTARYLGLRTEASARFERGIDPGALERASKRVCELVVQAAQFAGVTPPLVAPGLLDDHPVRTDPIRLHVRPDKVNQLLGTGIETGQILDLLEPIGFKAVGNGGAEPAPGATGNGQAPAEAGRGPEGSQRGPGRVSVALEVPTWRPDVTREVDVTEEVARMYGYRRIRATDRRSPYVGRLDPVQALRRRLRRVLCGLGAHEGWTASIIDPVDDLRVGGSRELARIANPMVAEQSALRAGMLGGLLDSVRYNSGHRRPWIRLFEMGDVFAAAPRPAADVATDPSGGLRLPAERERVGLVLAQEGDGAAAAMNAWRVVADALGIIGVELRQAEPAPKDNDDEEPPDEFELEPDEIAALAGLHPTRSALLVIGAGIAHDGPLVELATAGAPGGAGGLADGDGTGAGDTADVGFGSLLYRDESFGDDGGPPARAGTVIGTVGEVDPDVLAAFDLPHDRIGWLELDMAGLAGAPRRPRLAAPVSRYPSSDLDLAFVVDDSTPAWRVEAILRLTAGDRCEFVELFDAYRSPGADGKRSLACRIRFAALDHTLTEDELAELRTRCIEAVEAALPAVLRT